MSRPSAGCVPRLAAGCRFSDAPGQGDMLLVPEGALRLMGVGRKIVERCDGVRTFADIVGELRAEYPALEPARVEEEAAKFLERLHEKRALDF
ncbi:MAG: pyrroloquinoline quinone biosynthesis peptide chaperone PqqD [Acidobacteria bacterium]|nr:pyrroloquinoline quinone biosynthesis peptide chaperone PqqD [Acidobacteriota bacterium]